MRAAERLHLAFDIPAHSSVTGQHTFMLAARRATHGLSENRGRTWKIGRMDFKHINSPLYVSKIPCLSHGTCFLKNDKIFKNFLSDGEMHFCNLHAFDVISDVTWHVPSERLSKISLCPPRMVL